MTGAVEWLFGIINALLSSLTGSNSLLTADLADGIPVIYQYAVTAQQVVLPVGYTILSLFFVVELFNCARKVESAGGGNTMGVQMIIGVLIKLGLCKLLIDNTNVLMGGIYEAITYVTKQLAENWSNTGASMALLDPNLDGLGFFAGLGVFVIGLLVLLLVAFIWLYSQILIHLRFIELYLYLIIAPVPLATLPGDEWGQVGKYFLKSFASVAIHGTLLFLVLSFFPIIVGSIVLSFGSGAIGSLGVFMRMLQAAFYCLLLLFALSGTSRLAKSICNVF